MVEIKINTLLGFVEEQEQTDHTIFKSWLKLCDFAHEHAMVGVLV